MGVVHVSDCYRVAVLTLPLLRGGVRFGTNISQSVVAGCHVMTSVGRPSFYTIHTMLNVHR